MQTLAEPIRALSFYLLAAKLKKDFDPDTICFYDEHTNYQSCPLASSHQGSASLSVSFRLVSILSIAVIHGRT
jgi:hypothetical protein